MAETPSTKAMLNIMKDRPKRNRLGHPLDCISLENAVDGSWIVMVRSCISTLDSICTQHMDIDVAVKEAYEQWQKLNWKSFHIG